MIGSGEVSELSAHAQSAVKRRNSVAKRWGKTRNYAIKVEASSALRTHKDACKHAHTLSAGMYIRPRIRKRT